MTVRFPVRRFFVMRMWTVPNQRKRYFVSAEDPLVDAPAGSRGRLYGHGRPSNTALEATCSRLQRSGLWAPWA